MNTAIEVVYKKDASLSNRRSVEIERLDDESYVTTYSDHGQAGEGKYSSVRDSTNNLDLVCIKIKEFLKVGVPF